MFFDLAILEHHNVLLDLVSNSIVPLKPYGFVGLVVRIQFFYVQFNWRDDIAVSVVLKNGHPDAVKTIAILLLVVFGGLPVTNLSQFVEQIAKSRGFVAGGWLRFDWFCLLHLVRSISVHYARWASA